MLRHAADPHGSLLGRLLAIVMAAAHLDPGRSDWRKGELYRALLGH